MFIIIESINTKKYYIFFALAPYQVWSLTLGTGQARPSAIWRVGLTPQKGRQPKRQVSPRGGVGLTHAQSKGKPALAPYGVCVWPNARVGQPKR